MFKNLKSIPLILEVLNRLTVAVEALVDIEKCWVDRATPALEPARRLAEVDLIRKDLKIVVVMVSVDPNTGNLYHNIYTKTEFIEFLGERYTQDVEDFLNSYHLGTVGYIDGAFVMLCEVGNQQMNVMRRTEDV